MMLDDGSLDCAHDLYCRRAIVLDHDHELLATIAIDRKCDAATLPDRRYGGFDGGLDVLRKYVAPREDDHVLNATCDIKLTLMKESKVSGAKERSLPGSEPRPKHGAAFGLPSPVPARDGGAADPDFSDSVSRCEALGIDDANLLARCRFTAAHQAAGLATVDARDNNLASI